jgi:hypothetical protein
MNTLRPNHVGYFELSRPVLNSEPISRLQDVLNPVLGSYYPYLYNQRGHGRRNRELMLPKRTLHRLIIGRRQQYCRSRPKIYR